MVLQINYSLLSRVLGASGTERVRIKVVTAAVKVIITLTMKERHSSKRL